MAWTELGQILQAADKIASSPSTGKVLKVKADGGVEWATDDGGSFETSGTVASFVGTKVRSVLNDNGTTGPELVLYKNSTTPGNTDIVGNIGFYANTWDSGGSEVDGTEELQAKILSKQLDAESDSGDSNLVFQTNTNGTIQDILTLNGSTTGTEIRGANSFNFKLRPYGGNGSSMLFQTSGDSTILKLSSQQNTASSGWVPGLITSSSNLLIGSSSTGELIFATNNLERMRILNTGNVGIGTTTPNSTLQIGESGTHTGKLNIGHNSSYHSYIDYTGSGSTTLTIGNTYNSDSSKILFKTKESVDAMTILGSGNVGIGVTPTQKFHVSGNILSTGYVSAINYKINGGQGSDGQVITSTGSGVAWEAPPSTDVSALTSNVIVTKSDAKVQVQEATGASGYLIAQGVGSGVNLTTTTVSPIHLATNSGGPSTDYSIKLDKDSKEVYFSDKVGIGTDSPAGTLELENSSGSASLVIDGGTGSWQQIVFKSGGSTKAEIKNFHDSRMELISSTGTFRFLRVNQTQYAELSSSGLDVKVGDVKISENSWFDWGGTGSRITGQSGYIQIQTGSTDAIRIDNSQNVGIGTTTIPARLTIKGSDGSSGTHDFQIQNSSGSTVFSVNNEGSVNIGAGPGSFSSAYDAMVHGSLKVTNQMYVNQNKKYAWGNGTVYLTGTEADGINFYQSNTLKMAVGSSLNTSHQNFTSAGYVGASFFRAHTINQNTIIRANNTGIDVDIQEVGGASIAYFEGSNKRVGIGTVAPSSTLEVNQGSGSASTSGITIDGSSINSAQIFIDGSDRLKIQKGGGTSSILFSNTEMSFGAGDGNTAMTINSSKNVGIGTTDIDYALDVHGSIRVADAIYGFHTGLSRTYDKKWIQFGANQQHFASAVDRDIHFFADQGTDKPVLKVGGGSGYTRRVGINTLTPEKSLHIAQLADDTGIRLSGYDNMANRDADIYLDQFGQLQINNNVQSDGLGDPNIVITANQSGKLYSYADLVLPSSKVGIGTDSPSADLEIDGTTEMNWGGAYTDTSMANFKSVNNAGFYIRSYYAGGIGVAYNPITGASIGGGRLSLASHDMNYYLHGSSGSGCPTLVGAGDIALATGGTGSGAEGTRRLYIKNSDGFIGIGTEAPIKPLHISTTDNCPLLLDRTITDASGGALSNQIDFRLATVNDTMYTHGSIGYYAGETWADTKFYQSILNGGTGQVIAENIRGNTWKWYTGGTVALTLDSSQKATIAGNFQVGASAPSSGYVAKITGATEIVGNGSWSLVASSGNMLSLGSIYTSGDLYLGYNGTSDQWVRHSTSGNNIGLKALGAGKLKFQTYGVDRMTILSDGKVGIGTVSPDATFQVNGTGNTPVTIKAFGTNAASGINLIASKGTEASPTDINESDYRISMINFMGRESAGDRPGGAIEAWTAGVWTGGGQATSLRFLVGSGLQYAQEERMRITHEGRLLTGGTMTVGAHDASNFSAQFKDTSGTNAIHQFGQFYTNYRAEAASITLGRHGGTTSSRAIIAATGSGSGTKLGSLNFRAYSTGGGAPTFHHSASIECYTDENFATNSAPGALVFKTHKDWATSSNGVTERMRITSAGKVGIGTDSPANELELKDGMFAITGASIAQPATSEAPTNTIFRISTAYSDKGGTNMLAFVDDTDAIPFRLRAMHPLTQTTTVPAIVLEGNRYDGGANFRTMQDDRTLLQIRNHNDAKVTVMGSGNVGIGTPSPLDELHVVGEIAVEETSSSNAELHFRDTDQAIMSQIGVARGTDQLSTGSVNLDLVIRNEYDSNIIFTKGATEKMRIDLTNGRLGIGTTNPSSLLTVSGSAKSIGMSAGSADSVIKFCSDVNSSTTKWEIRNDADASLHFNEGANGATTANVLVLKNGGNVGIGTASPLAGSKLDIVNVATAGNDATGVGAIRIQDFNVNNRSNQHGGIEFKQASNQGYKIGTNAGDNTLSFLVRNVSASWSETMTLKQDKVGIGTNIPAYPLDVYGSVMFDGWIKAWEVASNHTYPRNWMNFNGGNPLHKTGEDVKYHIFANNTSDTPILKIGGSSNRVSIGMGSTNPSYKLDILHAGDAQFRVGRSAAKYVAIRDDVMQFTGMTGNGMRIQTSDNSDIKFSSGTGKTIFDYGSLGGSVAILSKLGIGTDAPQAKFHVEGESVIHENGTFQTALSQPIDDSIKVIDYIATRLTTATGQHELFLNGTSTRLVVPEDATWFFKINVVGRQLSNGVRSAGYSFEGVIQNDDDAVSIVGQTTTCEVEGVSTWTCVVSADDTNNSLKISVANSAAERTHWVADIHIVQTIGNGL